jgi:hypothetical protein
MVDHASLLNPKIGISGCSIYVIDQLLLQSLLLVSLVYGELPPRESVAGITNAEFGHEELMLTQVHRRVRVHWYHTLRVWTFRN